MNRIGLKLFCLFVACLLWLQVAATTTVDRTVALPLEITGLREGLTVAGSELPGRVPVRLRGSKLRLIEHRWFGRSAGRVVVGLAHAVAGEVAQHDLTAEDVVTDMIVVGLAEPVRLRLHVDRLATRRLPVRVVTRGEPPHDRALAKPPAAVPAEVVARGPDAVLRRQDWVGTEEVDLSRLRAGASLERRLLPWAPDLRLEPGEVRVEVAVSAREQRTFTNLPVVPLTDANQPAAGVFPPVATLVISGPADSLQVLTGARLAVTVSLTGLARGTHHVTGQAVLPEGYRLESLRPDRFVVRLGEGAQVDEQR